MVLRSPLNGDSYDELVASARTAVLLRHRIEAARLVAGAAERANARAAVVRGAIGEGVRVREGTQVGD